MCLFHFGAGGVDGPKRKPGCSLFSATDFVFRPKFAPDVITYSLLIGACEGQCWEPVLLLLQELKDDQLEARAN